MGLIKDALGSALGANDVKNGFNGPRLPFINNNNNNSKRPHSSSSLSFNTQTQDYRYDDRRQYLATPDRRDYRNEVDSRYGYRRQPSAPPSDRRYFQDDFDSRYEDRRLPPATPPPRRVFQDEFDAPPSYYQSGRTNFAGDWDAPQQRSAQQAGYYADERSDLYYSSRDVEKDYQPSQSGQFVQPGCRNGYRGDSQSADAFGDRSMMNGSAFRVFALPQIEIGEGKPFLRGYSDDLRQYGIQDKDFLSVVDSLNVAIIPNPEQIIFQKGANIAGWFLPGAASLGLMAGQFGVGIGAALGHASLVSRVLSKANLEIFLPKGLEICIGRPKNLDSEVGSSSSLSGQDTSGLSPEERISCYGGLLAPLSYSLPQLEKQGRNDPIAMLGRGIGNHDQQRKVQKAQKKMNKGKNDKQNALEKELKWLMVRKATPGALEHWKKTEQESEAALQREQAEVDAQRQA